MEWWILAEDAAKFGKHFSEMRPAWRMEDVRAKMDEIERRKKEINDAAPFLDLEIKERVGKETGDWVERMTLKHIQEGKTW